MLGALLESVRKCLNELGFAILRIMAIWTRAKWGADAVFDVLGEASAAVEPAEGPLDDPELRQPFSSVPDCSRRD
jgi:hypothetical protein